MIRKQYLHLVALGAILLLAAVLRFANFDALGYGNHYYTAGVASMLQSWNNFFFVAAEPGGSVSIDKPRRVQTMCWQPANRCSTSAASMDTIPSRLATSSRQ